MKKWIRWQGLLVFVAVLAVVGGIWVFLIDRQVELLIERTGSRIVGAKVELDRADLSLFPLGITLLRLQVTNPDEPMTNVIDVARIAGRLDGLNLLRRKIIFEEMSVEGVRLGTARTHSGAIATAAKKEPARESEKPSKAQAAAFNLPSFDLPSVQEILQKEELQTLKAAAAFQKELAAEKDKWQQKINELSDQKRIDDYKNRLTKLQASAQGGLQGIQGGVGELREIHQQITGEIDLIRKMQGEFTGQMSSFRQQIGKMEKLPQEDIRRLRSQYTPSGANIANLTRIILEGETQRRVETGLLWWERLKPAIERAREPKGKAEVVQPARGQGVNVRYPEANPLPDFLIRLMKISLILDAGNMSGRVENITNDQGILGHPLKFVFSGEKMERISLVRIEGVVDRVSTARASNQLKAQLQGYQIRAMSLSAIPTFPLKLAGGLVNLDLTAKMQEEKLDAALRAAVNATRWELPKKEETNFVMDAFSSALAGISNFSINAKVSGPVENYQMNVSSDLTDQVGKALQSQVQKLTSQFQSELSAAVLAKVSGPLQGARSDLVSADGLQKELETRLQQLTGLQAMQGAQPKLPGGLKLPFR